jgi:hypothetical protein
VFTAGVPSELLAVVAVWAPLTPLGIVGFTIAAVAVVVSWVLQWRRMNRD